MSTILQEVLVPRARECVGLSYGDPATRAAYLRHQYPGDKQADAISLGSSQSGCLLHLRGLLAERELDGDITWGGRTIDALRVPYASYVGLVEGLLAQWVRQRGGGARSYQGEARPELEPGELVVIGEGLQTHGLLVLSVDGDQVTSSDGGQSDPRNGYRPTAIAERTRTIARVGGRWCLDKRPLVWGWR